jgi:hypothetical protein
MSLDRLQEIELAIGALAPHELEALYLWLDQHCPHPLDTRIAADLDAGRLDKAIDRALEDEKKGRVRPL